METYTVFTERIQEFRSKTNLWESPIDTNIDAINKWLDELF